MRICAYSRPPTGTQDEYIMDVCLEILTEQIDIIKANYYELIGQCRNMFEFSNYAVISSEKKSKTSQKKNKIINERTKNLYQTLLDLQSTIDEL